MKPTGKQNINPYSELFELLEQALIELSEFLADETLNSDWIGDALDADIIGE